jgi:hypothetical protein
VRVGEREELKIKERTNVRESEELKVKEERES